MINVSRRKCRVRACIIMQHQKFLTSRDSIADTVPCLYTSYTNALMKTRMNVPCCIPYRLTYISLTTHCRFATNDRNEALWLIHFHKHDRVQRRHHNQREIWFYSCLTQSKEVLALTKFLLELPCIKETLPSAALL